MASKYFEFDFRREASLRAFTFALVSYKLWAIISKNKVDN